MKDKQKLNNLEQMHHSCAHLLAAAVLDLWPGTKLTIGPPIENGFYYDFEFPKPIGEDDLIKIEAQMKKILPSWTHFEKREVTPQEARALFKNNQYKIEIIEEIVQKDEPITLYKAGDFEDLCRGGHAENPAQEIGVFKLISIAGAYWRGDEKNPMLTRIYGTCFPTQKELDEYLQNLEEAKKRDHKRIGAKLDLFSFHEEGPGFVFWHPKGLRMRKPLIDFWQELHDQAGYEEVSTPVVLTNDVWKKSGHWDHYRDKIYFTSADKKELALKPMNCPGMMIIYKNSPHSYRELPIRWRELGLVHRVEPSGTLNGLLRERAFRQDDAHIFCSEDQIEDEVKRIIKLAFSIYKVFNFEKIQVELSTRPEGSIGSDKMWNEAEDMLKSALKDLRLDYNLSAGEGAFYGPKIDFHLTDCLDRQWQCGTIQLDFAMPERFNLTYIDKLGKEKVPALIHRAIFGSVHRFFAILIEHFAGAFPLWLSPVQVVIIPITDRNVEYAQSVHDELITHHIRCELDGRSETMQAKIRDATLQKVPYQVIIGDREIKKNLISVRTRAGDDLGPMSITDFIKKLEKEIDQKV